MKKGSPLNFRVVIKMISTRTILTISIGLTALFGDYVVSKSKYSNSFVFRALMDNSVHGVIGFLSALLFFNNVTISAQACMYNTVLCTVISSAIDIDHFIVARSFYLKDLTNLKQRGIFHCTTFWLLITSILIVYSHVTRKQNIYVLTYMIIIAFTSHHIRDANRRGLWMYPYGHTMPLHNFLYIVLICVLPTIFAFLYNYTKPMSKHTVLQYNEFV